jgi:hypothetical protein
VKPTRLSAFPIFAPALLVQQARTSIQTKLHLPSSIENAMLATLCPLSLASSSQSARRIGRARVGPKLAFCQRSSDAVARWTRKTSDMMMEWRFVN